MSLRPGWKMRFCFTQNLKPNQHTHIHISLINTNTITICSNILHEKMCGKQTPELSKNYINSALMDDNEGHFAVTPPVALHDCLTFLCPLVTIWQAEACPHLARCGCTCHGSTSRKLQVCGTAGTHPSTGNTQTLTLIKRAFSNYEFIFHIL